MIFILNFNSFFGMKFYKIIGVYFNKTIDNKNNK
nr:MAG TPA: hypothetical protein [Caudoviricetes sp.]